MNEDSGTAVYDYSGNDRNGTATGTTVVTGFLTMRGILTGLLIL
jgi:hypothetical protein